MKKADLCLGCGHGGSRGAVHAYSTTNVQHTAITSSPLITFLEYLAIVNQHIALMWISANLNRVCLNKFATQ